MRAKLGVPEAARIYQQGTTVKLEGYHENCLKPGAGSATRQRTTVVCSRDAF